MFGQFHSLLTLPRIVNMSMRGDSKTTQPAAVPASAADDSSSAACSPPAARGAAGARCSAPRAHDDLDNKVINSGESDVPDPRNVPEASRSPAVPHHSTRLLSNERTRDDITVCSAVMMNFVVRITTPHQYQLVPSRTSVMTMARAVVILKPWYPKRYHIKA